MRKDKFIYNTHSLQFEKVKTPFKVKMLRTFGVISAVFITALGIYLLTYDFFPSPKEQALLREMDQMKYEYYSITSQVDIMSKVLENIQERDASVHRMMFGMEPIDESVWNGGTGGHDNHSDLVNYRNTGELLIATQGNADKLERRLVIQSKSLDEIVELAKNREKMFASLPSIKPVREDKLQRKIKLLSGYGVRLHPVHKISKFHAGIDFTAPTGTAIQATGDGKVIRVKYNKTGYGKNVMIDHGYGYKTLYAHMKSVEVEMGQQVKKGQQIGTVGSTGTSTAPHCHYEVRYHNKPVNPINYCMDDLSPSEYQELVDLASINNQSFD